MSTVRHDRLLDQVLTRIVVLEQRILRRAKYNEIARARSSGLLLVR